MDSVYSEDSFIRRIDDDDRVKEFNDDSESEADIRVKELSDDSEGEANFLLQNLEVQTYQAPSQPDAKYNPHSVKPIVDF